MGFGPGNFDIFATSMGLVIVTSEIAKVVGRILRYVDFMFGVLAYAPFFLDKGVIEKKVRTKNWEIGDEMKLESIEHLPPLVYFISSL